MSNQIRICSVCGREVRPIPCLIFGVTKNMPTVCQCEIDRMEREEKEREQKERRRKIEKYFSLAEAGEELKDASLKNWEQTPDTQMAFREAVNFVKEWTKRKAKRQGLLFSGRAGNGKSHLAVSILKEIDKLGEITIYINVFEYLKRLKQAQRFNNSRNETELDLFESIVLADLIVLDDVGLGEWGDKQIVQFEEIIASLNFYGKVIIITTNLDPNTDLQDNTTVPTFDRLKKMCIFVENKGWSYRQKIASERIKERVNQ